MFNRFVVLLFCLGISLSSVAKTGVFPQSSFDELSYGLYWFGADDQYEVASSSTAGGSTYYDPTKPTMIFIHGWQEGAITGQERIVLDRDDNGWPGLDFVNLWRAEGYNVGMLYWDQFSDEAEVKYAEAKIWSVNGPMGMRWVDSEGTYHEGPNENVTQLLLEKYKIAMAGYSGGDVRLAGHSLGNQVALRMADELVQLASAGEIDSNIVPQRVSLLDPFYSNYPKSYLGWHWVGEKARAIVKRLKAADIAIDSYRTSSVTSTLFVGDENKALQNAVAFVEQKTSYFNQLQQSQKHNAGAWLYLWSILYSTPVVSDNDLPGISAASTNDEVREWMDTSEHLKQTYGGSTKDPSDDIYETASAL